MGNKIKVVLIITINSMSKNLIIDVEKTNLLKNLNIIYDEGTTIFQDSFGNLWAIRNKTKLQVLKVNVSEKGYVNSWQN